MKILQIIQRPQLRGAEIFTTQLSNHLLSLGHDCKLIAIFPGDAELPFAGEIRKLNRPLNKRLFDFSGWRAFAMIIAEEKPDVVQANAGDTLKFVVLSKLFFRWKVPIVYRNASMVSSYIHTIWTRSFNRFLYGHVDYIISVTRKSKEDLNQLFAFTRDKSIVIPVGVEISAPVGTIAKTNYPTLLHVGGFSFEKNHYGLLRIFKRIKSTRKQAVLWLLGDGPLRKEVESYCEQEGLLEGVKFFGSVSNVAEYMNAADVLLLPSIIEGLPAVLLEAMYHRCPVVAYDVGGVSEILNSNVTGILVNQGDEEGFAKAVVEVIENDVLRTRLIDNAVAMVAPQFYNREIALRFLKVYEGVKYS